MAESKRVIIELSDVKVPKNWDEIPTEIQKDLLVFWMKKHLHSVQIK